MRLNEIANDHNEIEHWLDSMEITNYTINSSGVVDVNNDVIISFKKLTHIPIQFGKVNGDFNCNNNELSSLKGAPQYIGGNFWFYKNQIKILSTETKIMYVGKEVDFEINPLTSLSGIHKIFKHVKKTMIIPSTIQSHILGLILIRDLVHVVNPTSSALTSSLKAAIEIINKHLKTDRDPMLAQRDLMKAGLREFARY